MNTSSPKIILIADWLTIFGGAERVLERFLIAFPESILLTTVFLPENFPPIFKDRVRTSGLQKLPHFLRKRHPFLLPFLPRAIESLDTRDADILLSSSSFVAKGALGTEEQLHICYCHSPTRYIWGDWQEYLSHFPLPSLIKKLLPALLSRLRFWDRLAAERPNVYIANSHFIQKRIAKYYKRDARVLSPPINTAFFSSEKQPQKKDFFLYLGRLVPQKRVDILVRAFRDMPEKKLIIAGRGPMKKKLKQQAGKAGNIHFVGFVPDEKIPALMARARALLFPQIEDAGITCLEALAVGTPVIAMGKGGVLTTLRDNKTALFFYEQTAEAIIKAVKKFEHLDFDAKLLKKTAAKYDDAIFDATIQKIVNEEWNAFREKNGE